MTQQDKSHPQTFENTLLELEEVVKKLESGSLGLEKSLEEFEKGVGLYKSCKEQLGKIENKVSVLTESLKEEDFESTDS